MDSNPNSYTQYSSKLTPLPQNVVNNVLVSALKVDGIEATPANMDALMHIAQNESSLESGAMNTIPVNGEHATGLFQTLPSTFNENAKSGYSDIKNPLDNTVAAINYMVKKYGSIENAWAHWQKFGSY